MLGHPVLPLSEIPYYWLVFHSFNSKLSGWHSAAVKKVFDIGKISSSNLKSVFSLFFAVVPGRPKIESVQPNATWTRIEFSRAEEMYCFGRRPPFTLLTEILVFDSNQNTIQNLTFANTQSILDAKILHDLVPYTNYSLRLRQRPMQKYLWSNATFSSFTTAMTCKHIFHISFHLFCRKIRTIHFSWNFS